MKVLDVYCRISSDVTGSALGVTRQEKDCRAEIKKRGWQLGKVLTDNDISAYSGKRRPAYDEALERMRAKTSDGLMVWHLDRLTRRPRELEDIIDIIETCGATIASVTGGDYDLSTTDGRAMARVVATFARKESEDKARRIRRKHLELAEAGIPVGGTRPFGYEKDRVTIRPDEAAMIVEAANAALAGEALRAVCVNWNRSGVRAPRGGRWTQTSIKRILLSPRVVGMRSLAGEVVAPGTWQAILDTATQERLRAVLAERKPEGGFTGRRPRTHLLTGLLYCGRCDAKLIARAMNNRRRSYVCPSHPDKGGCGGIRIVADPLERHVADRLFGVLADTPPPVAPSDPTDLLLDQLATVAADEARLAEDYYVAKVISRAQFLAATKGLAGRADEIRTTLAGLERKRAVQDDLTDRDALIEGWDDLSLERRRAVLEDKIQRIVIAKATPGYNRFDPDRITIEWR